MAFDLSIREHKASFTLPKFELYEQGSQIRRSSKTVKDTIAEGYSRRRYKQEFIRYLVFSISSCDETLSQIKSINTLYTDHAEFHKLSEEYDVLGKKINKYLQWVEQNWNSQNH